jgi:hypothetical protein
MLRWFILILAALTISSGCATKQQPKFQFPADTRVGFVNHLEGYATHQNFSSLRVGSFSKTIKVDWNIPAYIEGQLTQTLQKDPRYNVIPLGPAAQLNDSNTIEQISISNEIKPEVAGFLRAVADRHNLDVIIVIKSYRGQGPFKIADAPIVLQGYGLFTREFLMLKKASAYANFAVIVYKTSPLTYVGAGKPKVKENSISDFDLSGDLKHLPQSEIDKVQAPVQKYAEQAVVKALIDANLIESVREVR